MSQLIEPQKETLFGHPTGLYTLFFAEMWERFSYYGMRALLTFYMIKGFLSYSDSVAYTIYGAYTALVYMTPFFGGMIADRLLGARRAVILGGLLMAGGHLMMTIEVKEWFYMALGLLIVGNGFFKPNISTMVGSLYPQGSPKRDAGFTIFYIGINLGAAIAPLICGLVGETYGWHKGFGLATVGMLTGLAVFIAPTVISQILLFISCVAAALNLIEPDMLGPLESTIAPIHPYLMYIVTGTMVLASVFAFISLGQREQAGKSHTGFISNTLTQLIILVGAFGMALAMIYLAPDNFLTALVFYIMAGILMASALISIIALFKAGLPATAGAPPSTENLRKAKFGIPNEWLVYLLAVISVPVFMLLVSGFEPIFGEKGGVRMIPESFVESMEDSNSGGMQVLAMVVGEVSRPAGLILFLSGLVALIYLAKQIFTLGKVQRERMFVVMILTFFSMLFWAFFEQAGSSVNNFTDRNVDRVMDAEKVISESDAGTEDQLRIALDTDEENLKDLKVLTQEYLGYENGNSSMKELIAKAMRIVDRNKIENRKKEDKVNQAVDDEKIRIINEVWAEYRPEESESSEESAEDKAEDKEKAEEKQKTPEEKKAEREAAAAETKKIKASIKTAIEESSVLKPEDDAATDLMVENLYSRVQTEKTIDALQKENKLTMTGLTALREYVKSDVQEIPEEDKSVTWQYTKQNKGLSVGGAEIPASIYQSVNPIFILIFGLVFSLLWGFLAARGKEPNTAIKFSLGLIQLGLGFACFWMGAASADERGMSLMIWLVLGYLFQTTGELCLSPVGLSMVTKLSPARLVSTVMGTWFLATAFSQFLAGIIAQFTGVSHGGDESVIPVPSESIDVYGNVFQIIAISAAASGLVCLLISPILYRWMHTNVEGDGEEADAGKKTNND